MWQYTISGDDIEETNKNLITLNIVYRREQFIYLFRKDKL